MIEYNIIQNSLGQDNIKRTDEDGQVWFIPLDPANSDYQAYLATLVTESAPTA